jgi:hypothetical protein
MPVGAAVITNINAIVDQRAPDTMPSVTPAAAEASQMAAMNCVREKVVSVISTLLRVGFDREAPQSEPGTVDGREPANQADLFRCDRSGVWRRPTAPVCAAAPGDGLKDDSRYAPIRGRKGPVGAHPEGVLLERWLAQCGTTLPTIQHSTG